MAKLNSRFVPMVLLCSFFLTLSPFALDRTVGTIANLEEAYPQQQVMIMDLSALTCLSANREVTDKSLFALSQLSDTESLKKSEVCDFFYPQSWASVVFYDNSSSGGPNPIRMIRPSEQQLYNAFSKSWRSVIMEHPKAYLQVKIMLGSQFLFAGDSRSGYRSIWQRVPSFPLDLLRDVRFFSVAPFVTFLFIYVLRRWNTPSKMELGLISIFYFSNVLLISAAFIGDNQRYLIPSTLLSLLFLLLSTKANRLE